MPIENVRDILEYVQGMIPDTSGIPTILVFPETGSACTELEIANGLMEILNHRDITHIWVMDCIYKTEYGLSKLCKKLKDLNTDNKSTRIKIFKGYSELTKELKKLENHDVAIIGIHQRHSISNGTDRDEYDSFLRWCIDGTCTNKLLTPYTNFLNCSSIVQLIAISKQPEMFVPMKKLPEIFVPMKSNVKYINCRPWSEWRTYILSRV